MNIERWIDKYHLRSTATLALALWMLYWVTTWSMEYASNALVGRSSGTDVAAVIAAVQVPASFFAKWAFETFTNRVKS